MHNNFILAADTINNIARTSIRNIKKQTHAIIEADICLSDTDDYVKKKHIWGRLYMRVGHFTYFCTLLRLNRLKISLLKKHLYFSPLLPHPVHP